MQYILHKNSNYYVIIKMEVILMEHKEGCDRNQEILFPPKIDDYVGEENLVRFIEAFVSMLNLIELGYV